MRRVLLTSLILLQSCMDNYSKVVTSKFSGHTLHHNGVFSKDGQWLVFDERNDDTKIGETSGIGIVNIKSGEERIIYRTENQTPFGPGVGAASFSPTENKVIFIHGLADANQERPYAMTRRTGVGVEMSEPQKAILYDARDVSFPYTPGSLRGGTHSHCWSSDGRLISFTYNDEFVDSHLRTVGVMIPYPEVVKVDENQGNNNGSYFAAIVTQVVDEPVAGTNEINKAFDECWINGYTNQDGENIKYAIAFQGNVVLKDRRQITEVFIVDIDETTILNDELAVGGEGERPKVPKGIKQRRITFTENGLSDTRHWLRASTDGKYIYALAKDHRQISQLVQVAVNSGEITFLTKLEASIDYPFNINSEGNKIAFIAQNLIHILDLNGLTIKIIKPLQSGKVVNAPSFSPDGSFLVFNQYVKYVETQEEYLQIHKVVLSK